MSKSVRVILLFSVGFLAFGSIALKARDFNDGERLAATSADRVAEETQITHLIVKLKGAVSSEAGLSDAQLAALSRACGEQLTYVRAMSGGAHLLQLGRTLNLKQAEAVGARMERNAKNVEYASPDVPVQPQAQPNDTFYLSHQWHYHGPVVEGGTPQGLNLEPAWDNEKGSSEIVIAVIDTGRLPHVDLDDRTIAGYDMITDPVRAQDGTARDGNSTDIGDYRPNGVCGCVPNPPAVVCPSSWHGSHVAGTIGAETHNSAGVAGVNWNSKIQHVRVLGRCGGTGADIVDGIRWAAGLDVPGVPINPTPARVINMSLGGPGKCPKATQDAINAATKAGALVVVAAGNSSSPAKDFQPASCANTVTVHATSITGGYAYYSNFGKVTLSAPGGETDSGPPSHTATFANGILSTLDGGATTANNDNVYQRYQGTSMAAPHAAGVASLIISRRPSLKPAQVKAIMKKAVREFPSPVARQCSKRDCGSGILDASLAIEKVVEQVDPTLSCAPAPLACNDPFFAFPKGVIKGKFSYHDPSKNSISITQAGASFGEFDVYGHPNEFPEDVATCLYWGNSLLIQSRAPALDAGPSGKSLWKHTEGKGHNSYTATPNIDGVSSIKQTRGDEGKSKIVTVARGANLRPKTVLSALALPTPAQNIVVQHLVFDGTRCFQTTFPAAGVELKVDAKGLFTLNASAE